MSTKYRVLVTSFAKKHYIKKFESRYRNKWRPTFISVTREIEEYEKLSNHSIFNTICENKNILICKMEFRIAGKGPSKRKSGNRIILAFHKVEKIAKVLLVYSKQDLPTKRKKSETVQWKEIVLNDFPEYKDILKL